jgi:DnaB-like helicase C terminal domain
MMDNDQRLSGSLQENVLTVLCFDDGHCKTIRAAVTHRTFESAVFREVAGAAIDYIDLYGEAIKDHLPDSLEHLLKGDDARKASSYERLLKNLFDARERVNPEYVVTQLQKFVRLQKFKSALIDAVDMVESKGDIDAAEVIMQEGMRSQIVTFDRGLALDNAEDVASVFDDPEEEGFDLGIDELDRRGIIPRRKEVYAFIAARGKGKSWWVTHCSKQALIQRWSVVIVSLEMSQKRYAVRFLQAFFSISRREAHIRVARIMRDRDGNLEEIVHEEIQRMAMTDADARDTLLRRAKREFRKRAPIRIKQFPSGELTMQGLEAYLDGLERHDKFTPDVICLDYPELMKIDSKNKRIDLGQIVVAFRGMCVRRNAAGIIVSQGNREAEEASTVTGGMIAEDISQLATADVLLTYSQTLAEYSLGLARIFVEKARNAPGKMMVLVTQAYEIGQFCMDSVAVRLRDYFDMVGDGKRSRRRDDDDDDAPPRRRRRSE